MARVGLVPHHVMEWFGWRSRHIWYVACAAMLLAPIVATLAAVPGERGVARFLRTVAFVVAFALGMVPAFSTPEDGTALFVLHPSVVPLASGWEPSGRDRITDLREEADRYGSRGIGPCLLYRIADLERVVGQEGLAVRDEARAGRTLARSHCPRTWF